MSGWLRRLARGERVLRSGPALRQDDEFRRSTADAAAIVDRLRHIEGYRNEGVARQIEIYREAIAKVPQRS